MLKRLKPINDFIFKKVFGEEESKDSLIAFLNAVLNLKDEKRLATIEIIENKELISELIENKTSRLDVRARTADGTQLNIEVQLTDQKNMDKRTLFYWGKVFIDGIKKGQDYINLCKVITINILDFNFLDIDKFHSTFHLREDSCKDFMLTDLVEIHFIELPKFRAYSEKNFREDPLHRWLSFLEEDIPDETLKELIEMDSSIKKAEERLEYLSSDPSTIELYRKREESLHERANMISSAMEKGMEKGMKKGMEKGMEQGKQARNIEVAMQAIKEGLPTNVIVKITGLNVDEVKELASKIANN